MKTTRDLTLSWYNYGRHIICEENLNEVQPQAGGLSFMESMSPIHDMIEEIGAMHKLGSKVTVTMEVEDEA